MEKKTRTHQTGIEPVFSRCHLRHCSAGARRWINAKNRRWRSTLKIHNTPVLQSGEKQEERKGRCTDSGNTSRCPCFPIINLVFTMSHAPSRWPKDQHGCNVLCSPSLHDVRHWGCSRCEECPFKISWGGGEYGLTRGFVNELTALYTSSTLSQHLPSRSRISNTCMYPQYIIAARKTQRQQTQQINIVAGGDH